MFLWFFIHGRILPWKVRTWIWRGKEGIAETADLNSQKIQEKSSFSKVLGKDPPSKSNKPPSSFPLVLENAQTKL